MTSQGLFSLLYFVWYFCLSDGNMNHFCFIVSELSKPGQWLQWKLGKAKYLIGRTIAQLVRYEISVRFLAVLCKTTTRYHQNLHGLITEKLKTKLFKFLFGTQCVLLKLKYGNARDGKQPAISEILTKYVNALFNRLSRRCRSDGWRSLFPCLAPISHQQNVLYY